MGKSNYCLPHVFAVTNFTSDLVNKGCFQLHFFLPPSLKPTSLSSPYFSTPASFPYSLPLPFSQMSSPPHMTSVLLSQPCPPFVLFRLFEYRGRVSPAPRVVPVKRPRVAVPLVRRVKTLPAKLLARNASILPTSNGNKQRCEYHF